MALIHLALSLGFVVPENWPEPKTYEAPFFQNAPEIDGRVTEDEWSAADWSDPFVDIRGEGWPNPRHRTRFRLAWDQEALYVGAWLDEPELWATIRHRDAVIFHDSDFELFIDPDGDTHEYFELEINAFGTVWDLRLPKPYRDDGHAVDGWDIEGLRSAVHRVGTINRPGDRDEGWGVELAIPWRSFEPHAPHRGAPVEGEVWRVNFSRVQWTLDAVDGGYRKRVGADGGPLPEDNWVWSPQGLVNMHYPEHWGRVRFVGPGPPGPFPNLDPLARHLRAFYYQQKVREARGRPWTSAGAELKQAEWPEAITPTLLRTPEGWELWAAGTGPGTLHINHLGRIWRAP